MGNVFSLNNGDVKGRLWVVKAYPRACPTIIGQEGEDEGDIGSRQARGTG